MPSRKRSKGQARKASFETHLHERHFLDANGRCEHGRPLTAPKTHICGKFTTAVATEFQQMENAIEANVDLDIERTLVIAVASALKQYPGILDDIAKRRFLINSLVAHGALMLLREHQEPNFDWMPYAAGWAGGILLLERCESSKYVDWEIDSMIRKSSRDYLKMRDALDGCERSVVGFYSKRLSCSCLDEMAAGVKAQPKTGICDSCGQRTDRKNLMVCGKCKGQQYCSVRCQAAQWDAHRMVCRFYPREPRYSDPDAAWFQERVCVRLNGRDETAVIKKVNCRNALVRLEKDKSTVLVGSWEVSRIPPKVHDKVLVTGGPDMGIEGELVDIEGDDSIVKVAEDLFKIIDLADLATIDSVE